jgi:hypothetical protein
MHCPRCNSTRIQLGYDNPPMPLRFVGLRELLCNKCGLEFKGLDPLSRLERSPRFEVDSTGTHRRAPRYPVHIPATIYLTEQDPETGKLSHSKPSWGHCVSISKTGLTLSFVGTKFTKEEVSRVGQLLFVIIEIPNNPIEVVVSVVRHASSGNVNGNRKRIVGAAVCGISEDDAARLDSYLAKCAEREPVLCLD